MRKGPTRKERNLAIKLFERELAKGEKTKTQIYEDVGARIRDVTGKTVQRWVYGKRTVIEALKDEASAKCRKGDHSWFDDSRLEGLAYRRESFYELNDFGGIRTDRSTKTCYFCGCSQGGLSF